MNLMTAIPERITNATATEPARYVYHLAVGHFDEDATWQAIHCGAGIAFPWREQVERHDVCRACLKAAKR